MPCVYLPGPAPAVTVANKADDAQRISCFYRSSLLPTIGGRSLPKRLETQSAGPVHLLLFCSMSIILLASLVTGRKPLCTAGAE